MYFNSHSGVFPVLSKHAVDVYTVFDKCNGAFDQLLTIQKKKILAVS